MEPARADSRHNSMLADTSDIHALSGAQHRHADDLTTVAADLTAAQVSPDAFGSVGAGFLATLNGALTREARHAAQLAERLAAATSASGAAAAAYDATELFAGQTISNLGA